MALTTIIVVNYLLLFTSATPIESWQGLQQTTTIIDTILVDTTVTLDVYSLASTTVFAGQSLNAHQVRNEEVQSCICPPSSMESSTCKDPIHTTHSIFSSPTLAPIVPSSPTAVSQTAKQVQVTADVGQAAVNQQQIDTNKAQQASSPQYQGKISQSQSKSNDDDAGQASSESRAQVQVQTQTCASISAQPSQPVSSSSRQTAGPAATEGTCGQTGGQCSGDVTIYNDQGFGACGWQNDTYSEDFVALAYGIFGAYTNDAPGPHKNAMCGRKVAIQANGQQFSGMITDRCGGCEGENIDLSQHLFSQLFPNESPGNGRYHNVPWSFTDQGPYHGPS